MVHFLSNSIDLMSPKFYITPMLKPVVMASLCLVFALFLLFFSSIIAQKSFETRLESDSVKFECSSKETAVWQFSVKGKNTLLAIGEEKRASLTDSR